jgi:hypothetical protein
LAIFPAAEVAAVFCIGFVCMRLRRAHYTQMAGSVTTFPPARRASRALRWLA